jgi:hypothetical protein
MSGQVFKKFREVLRFVGAKRRALQLHGGMMIQLPYLLPWVLTVFHFCTNWSYDFIVIYACGFFFIGNHGKLVMIGNILVYKQDE